MIEFLSKIRSTVASILRRPKEALVIVLLVVVSWLGWRLKAERQRSQELASKSEGLPPGTQQIVQVLQDHVIIRWRDGPTKIEYRDRYLPPEGHVEVITKKNQPSAAPEVKIKDRGFTFRPGGGAVYSGHLLFEGDAKIAYWRRYSILIGVTSEFGGVGFSRHVDDILPFHNIEIQAVVGMDWHGQSRIGFGLRLPL